MIKAELFDTICFPEKYWYEDTIMTFLIYPRCSNAVCFCEDVYVYRRNVQGITVSAQGKPKSVDTYWITEQMITDMKRLNIKMNQLIYEMLLKQIALNYIRTETMDKNTKVAIYMLTREWFSMLHKEFETTIKFQKILEKALSMGDYKLYQEGCRLLWSGMMYS